MLGRGIAVELIAGVKPSSDADLRWDPWSLAVCVRTQTCPCRLEDDSAGVKLEALGVMLVRLGQSPRCQQVAGCAQLSSLLPVGIGGNES